MSDLAKLRGVLEGMTPGPWTAELIGGHSCEPETSVYQIPESLVVETSDGDMLNGSNARGIVALCNIAPLLLDVIERADEQIDGHHSTCGSWRGTTACDCGWLDYYHTRARLREAIEGMGE